MYYVLLENSGEIIMDKPVMLNNLNNNNNTPEVQDGCNENSR